MSLLFRTVATLLLLLPFSTGFSTALMRNQRHRFVVNMASSPLDTLTAGLAGLASRNREIQGPSTPAPAPHTPEKVQYTHQPVKKRAESASELGFEPVRIFGKGHPGSGGKGEPCSFAHVTLLASPPNISS
jgi:hypothetical protein